MKALSKPELIAVNKVLPAFNSSFVLSKIKILASTAIPTERIKLAYLDSSKEDVSSDREKENHELDIKINAIGHEIEKNVLENEKLSNELSALVANLPVIKKHATEATKNLNVVENKIRRINRVKESLNK